MVDLDFFGDIKLNIFDADGQPLSRAVAVLSKASIPLNTKISDSTGFIRFGNMPSEVYYKVNVAKLGFETQSKTFELPDADISLRFDMIEKADNGGLLPPPFDSLIPQSVIDWAKEFFGITDITAFLPFLILFFLGVIAFFIILIVAVI